MVKRPGRGVFPDLHVFPGGKVDEADQSLAGICRGLDELEASRQLCIDSNATQYWVAAIRECFEESGVLLAEREGVPFSYASAAERNRFQDVREDLITGRLQFSDFLRSEDLRLASDRVHYHSHWITPETAPARFDTRFFVAVMPEGQETIGHAGETVAEAWIRPEDALERGESGRWRMIYPTMTALTSVSGYDSVEAIVHAVREWSHLPEVTDELHAQGMQHHEGR